jgi:hypothetical protein
LSSDDSSVLWLCTIASFLFDTHPNIILHAYWLLLFKPSQLSRFVMIIAVVHFLPAAVQPPHLGASVVIKPCMTDARKHIRAVLLTALLLRTLTLTLKEPLWTKPKGGWLSRVVWICEVKSEEMRIVVLSTKEVVFRVNRSNVRNDVVWNHY